MTRLVVAMVFVGCVPDPVDPSTGSSTGTTSGSTGTSTTGMSASTSTPGSETDVPTSSETTGSQCPDGVPLPGEVGGPCDAGTCMSGQCLQTNIGDLCTGQCDAGQCECTGLACTGPGDCRSGCTTDAECPHDGQVCQTDIDDPLCVWPYQSTCPDSAGPGQFWGPCIDGACEAGLECRSTDIGWLCAAPCGSMACQTSACANALCGGGDERSSCVPQCDTTDDCPIAGMTCQVALAEPFCLWLH